MTEKLTSIRIMPFRSEMLPETSGMLAQAFVTNPLHETTFGLHAVEKNKAFFRTALNVQKGTRLVAVKENRILGFIHWVPSTHCQFSFMEKLLITPSMLKAFGIISAIRVSQWLAIWAKHDPGKAHLHLGPIGVHPEAQGHGIGRLLMNCYCQTLDTARQEGYLETDRKENVLFYRQFGFELIQELPVLGVKNYFMWRTPIDL